MWHTAICVKLYTVYFILSYRILYRCTRLLPEPRDASLAIVTRVLCTCFYTPPRPPTLFARSPARGGEPSGTRRAPPRAAGCAELRAVSRMRGIGRRGFICALSRPRPYVNVSGCACLLLTHELPARAREVHESCNSSSSTGCITAPCGSGLAEPCRIVIGPEPRPLLSTLRALPRSRLTRSRW